MMSIPFSDLFWGFKGSLLFGWSVIVMFAWITVMSVAF